ncbi:serine hydrolase domain-containing protein [Aureimonas altamirensis]|uniref:serine hydrolase domain-containing protein n=1 Tax=Aureimonas altamirensis TaxID=370622 RepID=UPI003AFAE204
MKVLSASALTLFLAVSPATTQPLEAASAITALLDEAERLEPLETVIVAHEGEIVAERGYRGNSTSAPTAIMSASKSVMSALIGIAIDRGVLEGPEQRIAPLLADDLPADPDPRLQEITVGHLLSMQAGLGSTSGAQYGAWVNGSNWVRGALARSFEDEPGGRMIYSTGSTHLLSAILTRQTGRSTLELARDWLGPLDRFRIASWARDPQGIHVGGNLMSMSPRSLLAFGELYRADGVAPDGERILPEGWIAASFEPRTSSRWTGDAYGYGWFTREMAGTVVHYGWGYGGQMIYVVPEFDLTVAMTSDESSPSSTGHRDDLNALLGEIIDVFAVERS